MPHPTFNPQSPEFNQNPQAVLERLREQNPIFCETVEASISGNTFTQWNFLNYADVLAMFRDERFVNQIKTDSPSDETVIPDNVKEFVKAQKNMMLFRDPPDHTRLRALVNKSFTPHMVHQLEPRIESITADILDGFKPGSTFDVVSSLAFPLPVVVIAELLGVPVADRERIKHWSQVFARTLDMQTNLVTLAEGNQMVIEFRDYFQAIIRKRTKNPRDDLVSALIQVTEDGQHISEEELLDMCILLLVAGHETTRNLIANAMFLLGRFPDAVDSLRRQPQLLPGAIEETLRFESPVMVSTRIVGEDISYEGHALHRGEVVAGWIVAANRDPKVFLDPNSFDVSRSPNRHLAFGQGIHYCLGAPLARLEGVIALRVWLERYHSFELIDQEPIFMPSATFRALTELRVKTD